jgi:hypothetical protein
VPKMIVSLLFLDQSFIPLLSVFSDIEFFRTGVLAQCPTLAMLGDLRFFIRVYSLSHCIYIPQRQGGPAIPPGTRCPF